MGLNTCAGSPVKQLEVLPCFTSNGCTSSHIGGISLHIPLQQLQVGQKTAGASRKDDDISLELGTPYFQLNHV